MYHGQSAYDKRNQRPIRNRGRDKKDEYIPPSLQGARDLRMDEYMEQLHPNRVTTAHPFPLLDPHTECPVIAAKESGINPLKMNNSLLAAYTSPFPSLDGRNHHPSTCTKTLSSTQPWSNEFPVNL